MLDRIVAVGRELTKKHESLAVQPIKAWLATPPPDLGEFVLVIYPPTSAAGTGQGPPDAEAIADEFDRLTNNGGLGRRAALKSAALKFSVSTRDVFAAVERRRSLAE